MTVQKGRIAGFKGVISGRVSGRSVIECQFVWKLGDDMTPNWPVEDGYVIEIHGEPNVRVRLEPIDEHFDGAITTAMPVVNAIPDVCAAPPGIVNRMGLPFVTGAGPGPVSGTAGRLEGKVALVTGGGSGIGRATALRLAAEGAAVVVNDRDGDAAAAVVGEVVAGGGRADPVVGDVAEGAVLDEAVATAVRRHGRLDLVHNNAGYGVPSRVAYMTHDELQLMLSVNLFGVLHGTRSALPVMIGQGSGSIVNTAVGRPPSAHRETGRRTRWPRPRSST